MNGVSFPRIGNAIRENKAVLSINKFLQCRQNSFFEQAFLIGVFIENM